MNKNRKIIYIEIDDELNRVLDKLRLVKKEYIFLVIPKKSLLFQSEINLKLVKTEIEKRSQKLTLVTQDRKAIHLAKKSNIKTIPRIEVVDKKSEEDSEITMKIRPIQARRNAVERESRPERVVNKKMSISELISAYRARQKGEGDASLEDFGQYFQQPGKKFLASVILLSAGLFMLIGYIALPSATVYIKPKFDNIDYSTNIVLADKRLNQNAIRRNKDKYIPSETVSTTTKQTKVFKTANQEFNGVNAKGKIKIVNTTNDEWELRGGTRFQSEEGIIFRTNEGVVVPPRIRNEEGDLAPGEMMVFVEADPFDIFAKPVGRRGNLPPTRFVMPALTKYNQRLIWGESEESMEGGVTDYRPIIQKEDIEAAKKQIQDNLTLMAREELRTYIDEVNQLNKTNLVLLDDSRQLNIELEELKISDDLEGTYEEKFEVFARISATGIAFNFDQLFEILKEELANRTHPNMRLREDSITPENITYEIIENDDLLGQIKLTATVVGIEEFAIDASTPAGIRFGNNIREKIQGLTKEKAENLIGNMPEVDIVEVRTWPIWISSIPRLTERIKVELMEDE